jgi:hypothetical protein
VALATTAGHWLHRLPADWYAAHHAQILALLGTTALAGLVMAALAGIGRPRLAVLLSALWMGLLVAGVSVEVLPRLSPLLSVRDDSQFVVYVGTQDMPVEQYKLPRNWAYGLNYYFDQELPTWSPDSQAARVYTTPEGLATIEKSGGTVGVMVSLHGGMVLARVSPGP